MRATFDGRWYVDRLLGWQYWKNRLLPTIELTPARISLAYTLFGFLALFASDVLFVRLVSEPLLSQIQALKGGIEIVLTAGFILVLTRHRETQLQTQRTRLTRQREELQVLHRVLRHNLRNDLNVIEGYVDRLCEHLSSNAFDEECSKVLESIGTLKAYTEKATQIRRINVGGGEFETYELTETIPKLLETNPGVSDDVEVTTSLPDRAEVEANWMFEEALDELLTNAVEHNDAERPSVTVSVRLETGPSHLVEIRITDNGAGIPASELDPLREGEESDLLHLSGMGLWFVEWTVHHSEGELLFEENEPHGTTVIVQVPKAPGMLSSTLSPLNGD